MQQRILLFHCNNFPNLCVKKSTETYSHCHMSFLCSLKHTSLFFLLYQCFLTFTNGYLNILYTLLNHIFEKQNFTVVMKARLVFLQHTFSWECGIHLILTMKLEGSSFTLVNQVHNIKQDVFKCIYTEDGHNPLCEITSGESYQEIQHPHDKSTISSELILIEAVLIMLIQVMQ